METEIKNKIVFTIAKNKYLSANLKITCTGLVCWKLQYADERQ